MARLTPALLLVLVLSAPLGCSEEKDHGTYATFNAGLAVGYVEYVDERQPLVGPGVAELESDVLCMQEVWMPEHVDDVLSATASAFPHSFAVDTYDPVANTGPPVCTEEITADMLACVNRDCIDVPPDGLSDCVLAFCGAELMELGEASPGCLDCLVANLGHTIEEIFTTCHSESKQYLYEAANGLILLSRFELRDTDHLVLDSTFNKRLALFARITNDAGEDVALVCTHLTPGWDDELPYTGPFGSWTEEQAHQIDQIATYIEENTSDGEMIVLMGDMNNGPDVPPGITGDHADNYQLFIDAGFSDPFVEGGDAVCTFCSENPILSDDRDDVLIDHVFFMNFPSSAKYDSMRILDETLTIGSVETPLSDHYGLSISVTE
jgi:endonuclease/exonuclease/phosphatase family metal-dependent hydrolase